MSKNKNWLDGIEELDNDHEIAGKKDEDDLSWLTAGNEEPTSFLQGIEKLEMKSFVRDGIVEIAKKKAAGKQLNKPEMKVLQNFNQSFPDIDIKALEEAANELE